MNTKRKFFFLITYFKPTGKYYTSAVVEWEIRTCAGMAGIPGADTHHPYTQDAVAKLRGLRDTGGPGALPGLHYMSEGWDGPILIQQAIPRTEYLEPGESASQSPDAYYADGVPHLIMLRGSKS